MNSAIRWRNGMTRCVWEKKTVNTMVETKVSKAGTQTLTAPHENWPPPYLPNREFGGQSYY